MSDSEYEEEEFLVYADFKKQILPQELNDPRIPVKVIGLETQNPVLEINGKVFKGSYDFAMGTHVFFRRDHDLTQEDPLFDTSCNKRCKYVGKTNKVLSMERVFIDKRTDEDSTAMEIESVATEETAKSLPTHENLKTSLSYEETIQQFPPAAET